MAGNDPMRERKQKLGIIMMLRRQGAPKRPEVGMDDEAEDKLLKGSPMTDEASLQETGEEDGSDLDLLMKKKMKRRGPGSAGPQSGPASY